MATMLGTFNSKLINFFEELSETFPEEKEIKAALEGLQGVQRNFTSTYDFR